MDDLLTTKDAAEFLRLSPERIAAMCRAGVLPATRHGRDWAIDRQDLAAFSLVERRRGRPRKQAVAS